MSTARRPGRWRPTTASEGGRPTPADRPVLSLPLGDVALELDASHNIVIRTARAFSDNVVVTVSDVAGLVWRLEMLKDHRDILEAR